MSLLTCNGMTNEDLLKLFHEADRIRQGDYCSVLCQKKIMATLFFEPSTRTRLSFESAMLKLGGRVISASGDTTSCTKGETIADTIKAVSSYADIIVVRSSECHTKWRVDEINTPVINAGDGHWSHPTQALLDAYTVWREFGSDPNNAIPAGLTIGVVGDTEYSRTISSFINMMGRSTNKFYVFDSTNRWLKPILDTPVDMTMVRSVSELDQLSPSFDVLYVNRMQKERWSFANDELEPYSTSEQMWDSLKPNCVVMNPGPRRQEMPEQFDKRPQNKMWIQAENGLYVRMAILAAMLS